MNLKLNWLRKNLPILGMFVLILIFFVWLYKIYIPRMAAFGCFDDCYNYAGGYFLTQGKHIYRDFFFNHLPSMAFISAIIQQITNPINLYEFLLRHRQFIFLWGVCWNLLFLFRFRLRTLLPILLFELTKFYLFGDRFLAESLIVYPFIYMTYLLFGSRRSRLGTIDILISYLSFLFISLSREPYVPTAALLYGFILYRNRQIFRLSFWVPITLVSLLGVYFWLSLPDMVYNIWQNQIIVVSDQAAGGLSLVRSFLYPILLIFSPLPWTYLRIILAAICLIFIVSCVLLKRDWKLLLFFGILLATANLRPPTIGVPFYSAFHLLPWYGIVLAGTISLIFELKRVKNINWRGLLVVYILVFVFSIFSPKAFFREKINPHNEFITNYTEELQISNVINSLSIPTSTLFLDGWAELIFPLTHLSSPYQYNWYTGYMNQIPRYLSARDVMFKENPPDFYYGNCPSEKNTDRLLPEGNITNYTNIPSLGKPTCLWVKTSIIPSITVEQWQKAKEQLYDKPL